MSKFKIGKGDWVQYRSMFNLSETDEIDLHFGEGSRPHYEAMAEIDYIVERGLWEEQRKGRPYLMFIHGWSTSKRGRTTARSEVRGFMRSRAATPLIERKHCIQHQTVFVTNVRPLSPTPVV